MANIGSSTGRQDIVRRDQKGGVGPGHYDSPSRLAGPSYTIQTKSPSRQGNENPAPGSYNQDKTFVQAKSRKAFIGGEGRKDMVSSEQKQKVGPG